MNYLAVLVLLIPTFLLIGPGLNRLSDWVTERHFAKDEAKAMKEAKEFAGIKESESCSATLL